MAEESNNSIAYLRALRQNAATDAEPPAAFASPTPADTEQYSGSEKRRSRRYKCQGSAQIREEGCDIATWASFTDVSLHGCYVEAQATYPAGSLLHMKLETNGIRVETKGTVRVTYPYLGMGIAFVDMSEVNQAQLRRMLATLTHPSMIVGPGIASSLPANGPIEAEPPINDPAAAVQALMEFFESRQMLMREDFIRIVRSSQNK